MTNNSINKNKTNNVLVVRITDTIIIRTLKKNADSYRNSNTGNIRSCTFNIANGSDSVKNKKQKLCF